MSPPWMPIYWGDYLKDTRDLTTLQHGAYLLLIAHYWQNGSLPTNEKQLSTIAGVGISQWRTIRDPIAAKFQLDWKHRRIDEELVKAERKLLQRAISGSKGGTAAAIARAKALAFATPRFQPNATANAAANGVAHVEQKRTSHISKNITTTTSCAETEEGSAKGKISISSELVANISRKGFVSS